SSVRLSLRARMILLAAEGLQNKEIAEHLGVDRVQAARWRKRYLEQRLAGIELNLPRGAHPVKVVEAVVRSHRLIAKPAVSPSTYPMPLMSLARFAGCLSPWPTKRWIQPG
ncbi:helix-turn-helix domain-containing protein, partial [Acidithiobacillus thiooxidans]